MPGTQVGRRARQLKRNREPLHPEYPQRDGRFLADRVNLARAFLAKAMWDMPTTRALIGRLEVDPRLRNLCGWIFAREIPSESTFSWAFAEFAESDLAGQMHEALIKETLGQGIVGPVSRDSTAIPAREKPTPKGESDQKSMKRKRGRLRKGEVLPPKAKTRFERQAAGDMTLEQMLDDLQKACGIGAKVDAQGNKNSWVGYKLHIDTTDAGIPVSCILSSASLHDSQVAIPLADLSTQRVTYLYECMDSAYARLCTKFAHVHVQKISFVAISSRASSRGKMIPPKSPTSFQCPR